MSNEYPKALHTGNQKHFESLIAEDAEQEKTLREKGYGDYSELREFVQKSQANGSGANSASLERIIELEDQLATAKGEFIAFQNDVAAMKARISELQGDTTPIGTTSDSKPEIVDYNDMTIDQLQALLNKKGIKYLARDNKPTLIKLLSN